MFFTSRQYESHWISIIFILCDKIDPTEPFSPKWLFKADKYFVGNSVAHITDDLSFFLR